MDGDAKALRTKAALEKTMYHLLNLLDTPEFSFAKLHKFQWDRYRGVRQDLNTQVHPAAQHEVLHCLLNESLHV